MKLPSQLLASQQTCTCPVPSFCTHRLRGPSIDTLARARRSRTSTTESRQQRERRRKYSLYIGLDVDVVAIASVFSFSLGSQATDSEAEYQYRCTNHSNAVVGASYRFAQPMSVFGAAVNERRSVLVVPTDVPCQRRPPMFVFGSRHQPMPSSAQPTNYR